jgi:hypothetical protein
MKGAWRSSRRCLPRGNMKRRAAVESPSPEFTNEVQHLLEEVLPWGGVAVSYPSTIDARLPAYRPMAGRSGTFLDGGGGHDELFPNPEHCAIAQKKRGPRRTSFSIAKQRSRGSSALRPSMTNLPTAPQNGSDLPSCRATRSGELSRNEHSVVDNIITARTSAVIGD